MNGHNFVIFILSMLPIFERTTIPLAIGPYNMTWQAAFGWALAGNLVPVIPLLLILDPAVKLMTRLIPSSQKLVDWFFDRARNKHSDKVEKYGALGIAFLVSIPVPGFGPWTGVLLAYLFEVRLKYAIPAIFAGATVACALLTAGSTGAVWINDILHGKGGLILSAIFIGAIAYILLKKKK